MCKEQFWINRVNKKIKCVWKLLDNFSFHSACAKCLMERKKQFLKMSETKQRKIFHHFTLAQNRRHCYEILFQPQFPEKRKKIILITCGRRKNLFCQIFHHFSSFLVFHNFPLGKKIWKAWKGFFCTSAKKDKGCVGEGKSENKTDKRRNQQREKSFSFLCVIQQSFRCDNPSVCVRLCGKADDDNVFSFQR